MTRGAGFIKKGHKIEHCSSLSSSAWCDLKSQGDVIKLHDKSPNPKSKYQQVIFFTPYQYKLKVE